MFNWVKLFGCESIRVEYFMFSLFALVHDTESLSNDNSLEERSVSSNSSCNFSGDLMTIITPSLIELGVLGGIAIVATLPVLISRIRRAHFFKPAIIAPPEVEHRISAIREEIAVYRQMLQQSPNASAREINAKITRCEEAGIDLDNMVDLDWRCPILHRVMSDPVTSPDGHYYERSALQSWYNGGARQAILNYHLALPNPASLPTELKLQVRISNRLDEIIRNAHLEIPGHGVQYGVAPVV